MSIERYRILVYIVIISKIMLYVRPYASFNFLSFGSSLILTKQSRVSTKFLQLNLSQSYGSIPESNIRMVNILDIDGIIRSVRLYDSASTSNPGSENIETTMEPVMVLIGGTAQTINTFSPHVKHLSRGRRLIVPELRCQGKTELLCINGTIAQHVHDLRLILDALGVCSKVDVVGFSFGGRVGLAFAAHHPHLTSRLSVTGVPLTRSPLGCLILKSWGEALPSDIRSAAWSFLLNGYSEKFLEQYHHRLPQFVDMVIDGNDPYKLSRLMEFGQINDDDAYSVKNCAERVQCPTQVIGATQDRIASINQVKSLATAIPRSSFREIVSGHLAPFEEPLFWRKLLLDHLNSS